MVDPPAIVTNIQIGTREPRKPHAPYSEQERRSLIERMIEQRIRTHSSWEQVAASNNVGLRTAERWKQTDEWRQIESHWRRLMREETRTLITEVTGQAVDVLIGLMLDPKVPTFTRMHCAKALLEFGGVADEIEEIAVDQHDELMDFLKHTKRSRSVGARVRDIEPLASGLLPPQLQELAAELPGDPILDSPDMPPLRERVARAPETHAPDALEAPRPAWH